jgi:hypothetical protein
VTPIICGRKAAFFRDHLGGQAARAHDFLPVVDVVQKGVDRPHALFDAALELGPFPAGDDAGDDVEGDEPLCRLFAPIDVEGDAGQAEHLLGLALFGAQTGRVFVGEPVVELGVRRAEPVVSAPHFVKAEGLRLTL